MKRLDPAMDFPLECWAVVGVDRSGAPVCFRWFTAAIAEDEARRMNRAGWAVSVRHQRRRPGESIWEDCDA